MEKYIGKKLEGRYEIKELIGFGGMAVVFKAYDLAENRYVAVKILKDEYLESEDFKRRFRNESKAIALLSHPNIVKVYDVNFSDNIQYIVMEYIDGITLKEYISQQKIVKWKEVIHFTVQILRALQHAHDNGIVHRDIKPQNIMLLEDGTIKVMDFGIARFARESGKTLSDKAIGSVHYISPEQAKGEPTDEKTDIYAVGVIMYEMLTGSVPFDGDTPVSIAIKQMQQEPKKPRELNSEIPIGLEEIIVRAMQKDCDLRYATAAEMLLDIDEFKQNPDVVFEYKYFNEDGTTKYFDKAESAALSGKGASSAAAKKKSYTMHIIIGVTVACVVLLAVALIIFFNSLQNKPGETTMIDLRGITVEDAQKKLPNMTFEVIASEPSIEYEENKIISQNPDVGTSVKVNATIQVTISSGLIDIEMPQLENELASNAKARLEALTLQVEQVDRVNSEVNAGYVIETDPPAGTKLDKNAKVVIYVSLGAADLPVTVPNLLGMTESEAQTKLLQYGLILGQIETADSNEEKGTIIAQAVQEGSKVTKNTAVGITVSNGKGIKETVSISVPLPSDAASANVEFTVYINGQLAETRIINPAATSSISLSYTRSNGKIHNSINSEAANTLTIMVAGQTFARYNLDFAKGTATLTSGPDNSLLGSGGTSSVAPESGE